MSGMRVPVSPLTTRHRHTALLRPYTLGHRVVSCGDYATFIADGGYQLPALWLSDGWALATAQGWRAPLYWLTADDPRLAGQPPRVGRGLNRDQGGRRPWRGSPGLPLAVKRLDFALQRDQQRLALAVQRLAGWHFDPAFTGAVFLDVQAILAVEPDANVMLEHGRDVVGAARGPRTNGRAEVARGWLRSWGSFFNQRKIAPISMISCPWRRTDPMQECFAVGRWFPGH